MERGVWVDSDPGDQIIKSPASSNNVPFLPGYVVGSRERICRGLCSSRAISKRFQKEVCVELLRVEKENWIEGGGRRDGRVVVVVSSAAAGCIPGQVAVEVSGGLLWGSCMPLESQCRPSLRYGDLLGRLVGLYPRPSQ